MNLIEAIESIRQITQERDELLHQLESCKNQAEELGESSVRLFERVLRLEKALIQLIDAVTTKGKTMLSKRIAVDNALVEAKAALAEEVVRVE